MENLESITITLFVDNHLTFGYLSWWLPVFSLPIKCQESQPKNGFASKAASQLNSLACCQCVQKTCAVKHGSGNTDERDLILQVCQFITNLTEKCPFYLTLIMHWKQTHVLVSAHCSLKQPEGTASSACTAILWWRWEAGKSFLLHYPLLNYLETKSAF